MATFVKIPGFEEYGCSESGVIFSLSKRAGHYKVDRLRVMKSAKNKGGYLHVGLRKDGKHFGFTVHRLVALVWIGPKPDGKEVNHKDGNKLNNYWGNLEYVTHAENIRHAWEAGLRAEIGKKTAAKVSGEKSYRANITDVQLSNLLKEYRNGARVGQLAAKYGVHQTTVSHYIKGDRRKLPVERSI